jgi:signal transduction histidine kinase
MRARVEADGGHFSFHSGPGGTEVAGEIPIQPAAAP